MGFPLEQSPPPSNWLRSKASGAQDAQMTHTNTLKAHPGTHLDRRAVTQTSHKGVRAGGWMINDMGIT